MITVEHPKAGKVQFPDGTSPEEMAQAMAMLDAQYAPPPAPELPRPDTTTGPTAGMDPFARTGYLMASPEGQQAMKQVVGSIKSMGLVGGGAAAGQWLGAMGGPVAPITVPALGAVGAAIGSFADMSTDNTPGIQFGRLGADAASGMIPGGNIATASGRQLAARVGAEGAANVGLAAAQTGVDERRLITAPEAIIALEGSLIGAGASRNAGPKPVPKKNWGVRAADVEAINAMRKLGVKDANGKVVQSVVVDPGALNDKSNPFIRSVAGKAAMGQEASIINADALHAAAREAIGLSATADPIHPREIQGVIKEAADPYRRIAAMSEKAAADLEELKKVRTAASAEMNRGRETDYAKYKELRDRADALENAIQAEAKLRGDETMLTDLKQARKRIAQSYALLDSVSLNGVLDPRKLRNQQLAGVPLSDNLETIAKFTDAVERNAVPANKVLDPSTNQLDTTGGMMAAPTEPSMLLSAFGIPRLRQGARNYVLSAEFQDKLLNGQTAGEERFFAAMARLSGGAAGRHMPEYPPGYYVQRPVSP